MMTREEVTSKIAWYDQQIEACEQELANLNAKSMSTSAGGGSKSATLLSVDEIKAKIKYWEKRKARLLGGGVTISHFNGYCV